MKCTRIADAVLTLASSLLLTDSVKVQAQDPSSGTVTVPADLPPYSSLLVGVTGTGTISVVSCPRYAVMVRIDFTCCSRSGSA